MPRASLRVVGPKHVIYRGVLYELVERPRIKPRTRQIKGFYTDEEKRVRPITQRQARVPRALAQSTTIQPQHPSVKRSLRIDPLVREKYDEWLRQFREDRGRGSGGIMLPVGALQRYYEKRRAAFIEAGGSGDAF